MASADVEGCNGFCDGGGGKHESSVNASDIFLNPQEL
jgi:hypothetical protein